MSDHLTNERYNPRTRSSDEFFDTLDPAKPEHVALIRAEVESRPDHIGIGVYPNVLIRRMVETLEAQQAELDAARDVVEAARMVGRFDEGDFSRVVDAVATYDAARAGQEES